MDYRQQSLKIHEEKKGKVEVTSKVKVENKDDLSIAYTPGVAEPCRKIHENPAEVYKYTSKGNLVAVVTDGSAVLGLGNIGPQAAMPVMEGKAILFKEFADIDAFPICLNAQNIDEIVNTVKTIAPTFGGINLEDISAPRCFEIEKKLKEELDIPVFHDDQHGTAIVVTAGLINSLKLVDKNISNIKVVVNGAGSAGIAIVKMLLNLGAKNILVCDKQGILYKGNCNNPYQEEIVEIVNKDSKKGTLEDALVDADVFIGVSAGNIVSQDMIKSMNNDPIVFAMANPIPEIMPDLAKEAGARVVGSGRSDFPNQINNVLAFPGIFKGALKVKAKEINEEMKLAAAYAIANIIEKNELKEDYVVPAPLDKRVVPKIAEAVAEAAKKTGAAKI
ncbi:NADP-dependent malic enzyme [Caldisalinibacter kiritimatiensis]|uniref:NADP-dependent malic enzyme n=2 Tax=Caldisalinibacter kiritimatiensis TaxID=1304284 RepID=R1CNN7_9FIRM|nr:NADP-dependent malic enzyme [Caldisalinibacter kiritimatiensis]